MVNKKSTKSIKIKCKGSGQAELGKLKILQGELKELSKENYKKLRKRIETYGFDAPFFVWNNYILDGTQRKRVLEAMLNDGWELPGGKVPIVEIQADNLKDAKERLLGYVSQYGKVTEDGLYEFMDDLPDMDLETLDIPDIDMDKIEGLTNDLHADKPKTIQTKAYRKTHILLSFPPDRMMEIQEKLTEILLLEGVEYERGSN